jgi:hypothetical protein
MRKIAWFLFLLVTPILFSVTAVAQIGAIMDYCNLGAAQAKTSGLQSSNYLQGVIPSCTVTVYLTGTTTLATIYADSSSTPLTNPFTATTAGQWIFYTAIGQGYDVVLSGGISPNTYPAPVTLTGLYANYNFMFDCVAFGCVSTTITGKQTLAGPLAWTGGNTGTPAVTTLANLGGISSIQATTQSMAGGLSIAGNLSAVNATISGNESVGGQINSSQTELNNSNPSGSVVSIKNFNASGWLENNPSSLISNPTPTASTASAGSTATFILSAAWHLITGEITVKVGSSGTAYVVGPGFSSLTISAMAALINANPNIVSASVTASVSGNNLILTGPVGSSGSTTLIITGTVLNEITPIATTASAGTTSITLNQTCSATGFDSTNAGVQYGNQKIYIAGAGSSGVNYIGTVTACTGSTATISPAISTSVTNAIMHHDETNAFQSAITSLASTGGKISIPNGYYRVNGPLQDTSYANAIIEWPQVAYLSNPVNLAGIPIELEGTSVPTPGCTYCTVIQTDQISGNMFGAYNYTAGGSQPFTNIGVTLKNIVLRAYPNQSIQLFDGSNIVYLIAENVEADSGASLINVPSPQWPTSTNGNGIIYPHIGNNVINIANNVWSSGMYYGLVASEHTTVLNASGNTNHDGIVFNGGTTSPSYFSGNGISVVEYWCQGCYHTASVISPSFITAVRIDSEEGSTGYTDWYDPSGYAHGLATIYSIEPPQIVNASADMQLIDCYILSYLKVPCTYSTGIASKSYFSSSAAVNHNANGQIAGSLTQGLYIGSTSVTNGISAALGVSRANPTLASTGNDQSDGVGINISGFWQGTSTGVPLYLGYSYNSTAPWLTINNGVATASVGLDAPAITATGLTTGTNIGAQHEVTINSTPSTIATLTLVGGLTFVNAWNTTTGGNGWWLVGWSQSGTATVISSYNGTGLTIAFTVSTSNLQMAATGASQVLQADVVSLL